MLHLSTPVLYTIYIQIWSTQHLFLFPKTFCLNIKKVQVVQPSQIWRKIWKWFCFGTSRSCIWVLFSFGRSCIWVDALIRVIKGSAGAAGANVYSQWMQTKYIWHMILTIFKIFMTYDIDHIQYKWHIDICYIELLLEVLGLDFILHTLQCMNLTLSHITFKHTPI